MVIRQNPENPDEEYDDDNLLDPAEPSASIHSTGSDHSSDRVPFLQRLGLRTKVALFAVAISTLFLLGLVITQSGQSYQMGEARQHKLPTQENSHFAAQPFLLAYLSVAGLSVILVGGMTVFLTNCVIRPVLRTSSVVRKLGEGCLDTRLAVQGRDELAVLASNINWMADQFQSQLQQQLAGAQQIQLLKHVTLHLAQAHQVDGSLKSVVQGVRDAFQFDRVLIYRIDETGTSTLVAESVAPEWMSIVDSEIAEPWLRSTIEQPQGHVEAISDIALADLPEQQLEQLASLSIKASLIAPIVVHQQCLGVLIAHQCQNPYVWQMAEIDAWAQLAVQIGLAWERTLHEAKLAQHEAKLVQLVSQAEIVAQGHQQQQDLLQTRLTQLLKDVECAASGDLTVRTTITREDRSEIAPGDDEAIPLEACEVIAHRFNVTLENLHEMVTQVKRTAVQLDAVAAADEQAIYQLDEALLRQPEALTRIGGAIEDLVRSLHVIVTQIHQASNEVQAVLDTTETSAQGTRKNFLRWQEIATETIEQVSEFGYDYQEMTRIATWVNQLMAQINLLDLNASIKTAQVEGSAQGFELVATQMSEFSNQLHSAIHEVEQFTLNLQHETSRVVKGIEHGISLISLGEDFGEASDQHLEQIRAKSSQLRQMMQSLARTAKTQSDTAQALLTLMQELASGSNRVSSETDPVERPRHQLTLIAQQLQHSIQSLKVRD